MGRFAYGPRKRSCMAENGDVLRLLEKRKGV
jgi:hypothetical protein